ncbi:TPA: hypothetical protein ACSIGP_001630, partial [Neisseria gonorrhoeae]
FDNPVFLIKMNETDLPKLLSVINRFTDIDKNWSCVLLFWIQRASGYLEMMTLDDDENTATFLIEKLEKLLEPLPIDIDNTTFAEALADDFEILFLMAQYGSEYWNSLEESFEEFCIRHTTLPNQLIADIPHAKKEKVTMWLKSLLKSS